MTAPKVEVVADTVVAAEDAVIQLRSAPEKTPDYVIPDDHTTAAVSINRCTADAPDTWADENFHVGCFVLATGNWKEPGPTWRVIAFFHASGGVVKMSNGQDAPASVVQFALPAITSRRLKVSYVTIDGTPAAVASSLVTGKDGRANA